MGDVYQKLYYIIKWSLRIDALLSFASSSYITLF
jgi:hypothetical protein